MQTATELQTQAIVRPPATLHGWLKRGEAVLVDVREIHEQAEERIPSAVLMPLPCFDAGGAAAGLPRRPAGAGCRNCLPRCRGTRRPATPRSAGSIDRGPNPARCQGSSQHAATREQPIEQAGVVVMIQGGPGYAYVPQLLEAMDELGV